MDDKPALSPSFLASFVRAIAVLALPAEQQLGWLRTLPVVVGNVDELALEFEDGYRMVPQFIALGWLAPAIQPAAFEIARQLQEMSGPDGPWAFDKLADDPRWSEVRAAATEALGVISKGVFIQ